MVGNFVKVKIRSICIFLLLCLFLQNCSDDKIKFNEIKFKISESKINTWNSLFPKSEIINLRFDDPNMEIYKFGTLITNSKNQYFVYDGNNKNGILFFDSTGKFVKYIGRYGEGPGEYLLPTAFYVDSEDNFYLHDLAKFAILKFSKENYSFEKMFKIKISGNKFVIDKFNNLFSYSLHSDTGYIFFKYNLDGKLLNYAIKPKSEKLRLFIARFNLGSIVDAPGLGILGMYPSEYKIYLFNTNLEIKKTLLSDSASQFQPTMDSFPNDLSPFAFSKKHSKWWGKQLRPFNILYLGERFFMVILAKYENLSEKFYVNIHDLDGNTYAEGLEVPFNGLIKCINNGYVYLLEESSFDENGEVSPEMLHRYKFKFPN